VDGAISQVIGNSPSAWNPVMKRMTQSRNVEIELIPLRLLYSIKREFGKILSVAQCLMLRPSRLDDKSTRQKKHPPATT